MYIIFMAPFLFLHSTKVEPFLCSRVPPGIPAQFRTSDASAVQSCSGPVSLAGCLRALRIKHG